MSDQLKRSRAFSFDPGTLTVREKGFGDQDGSGYFCFKEDDLDWEQDSESGRNYVIINIGKSEFIELRDFLDKFLREIEV